MNILSRAWPRLSSQQENQPALGSFLSPLFHLIPFRIRHISPMLSSSFLLSLPTHPFVTAVHAFSHVLVAGSSSFSHLSRRSTPLSLSSPVVNAVSVVSGRLYTYISPPASQLSVFSPLFGGAGTPAPIDSFPGNMKERVRRTWFIDFCFDERSTVSVDERMEYRKRYRRSEWNNYRGRNYPATLLD